MHNVIADPTKVTPTSSTLIDPIVISDNLNKLDIGIIEFDSEI